MEAFEAESRPSIPAPALTGGLEEAAKGGPPVRLGNETPIGPVSRSRQRRG